MRAAHPCPVRRCVAILAAVSSPGFRIRFDLLRIGIKSPPLCSSGAHARSASSGVPSIASLFAPGQLSLSQRSLASSEVAVEAGRQIIMRSQKRLGCASPSTHRTGRAQCLMQQTESHSLSIDSIWKFLSAPRAPALSGRLSTLEVPTANSCCPMK